MMSTRKKRHLLQALEFPVPHAAFLLDDVDGPVHRCHEFEWGGVVDAEADEAEVPSPQRGTGVKVQRTSPDATGAVVLRLSGSRVNRIGGGHGGDRIRV